MIRAVPSITALSTEDPAVIGAAQVAVLGRVAALARMAEQVQVAALAAGDLAARIAAA